MVGTHGAYTIVDSTGEKLTMSNGALKLGGNGTSSDKNISIKVTGTGTVTITVSAYIDTAKNATLAIQQDSNTAQTKGITTGNSEEYVFEFEISGESTFYIYRSTGTTGVLLTSIVTSYFEE